MKKQNLFGEMVKKAGAKAAVSTANKASVFYCYQPKRAKRLRRNSTNKIKDSCREMEQL